MVGNIFDHPVCSTLERGLSLLVAATPPLEEGNTKRMTRLTFRPRNCREGGASRTLLMATTGQGNELTFGLNDFDLQLRRWRLVHDHAQRFGKHISLLDLAVANNAPMLWTDVSGIAPLPPPKPIKASRYKKKNV